jgi:Resolvase, N terminal domain
MEFVDQGVSGAKDRRPALDELLKAAKRRRFDVLVCWRLDRLGRNLRHLILLLDELQALEIAFATLGEGLDTSTPAGRLQLHVLSAIAEFERARVQERVVAGLARARAQGRKLGRPEREIPVEQIAAVRGLPVREASLVGVFGGPDFIVHYRNGDRTSYVMSVFEATATDHVGQPDGHELLELRFMTAEECADVALARWMPPVLDAVFKGRTGCFQE